MFRVKKNTNELLKAIEMTEETTPASAAAETDDNGPAFAVQRIYLKDLSFVLQTIQDWGFLQLIFDVFFEPNNLFHQDEQFYFYLT